MNTLALIKLEFLKLTNKSFYILFLLTFAIIFLLLGFNNTLFEEGLPVSNNKIASTDSLLFLFGMIATFVLYALVIIFSINNDVNNNIIVKHLCDGMTFNNYLKSKTILMAIACTLFILFLVILLAISGFYLSVPLSNYFNILSHQFIVFFFSGIITYSAIGLLWFMLTKNSVIAVFLIIVQFFVENNISRIEKAIADTEYCRYLPFTNVINILFDYSDITIYLLVVFYTGIFSYFVIIKLKKNY